MNNLNTTSSRKLTVAQLSTKFPALHYHVHRSRQLVSIQTLMNPFHITPHLRVSIYVKVSPVASFLQVVQLKCVHFSSVSCVLHASLIQFLKKRLVLQFSPSACYSRLNTELSKPLIFSLSGHWSFVHNNELKIPFRYLNDVIIFSRKNNTE